MNQKQYLTDILQQQNIALPERQTEQLLLFYELLVEKNKVMNLTAITQFEEVCSKHFADSLSIARLEEFLQIAERGEKLIDVGCGAGFPGLVLAIAYPPLQVTLLDSLQKRVNFLCEVIEKLALDNCVAIHGRAEETARKKEHREQYHLAVSRAVANLATLSEYCLPFVKQDGLFVAYKSGKVKEEAPLAEDAIRLLGGTFERQEEFYLTQAAGGDDYRNLYMVRKKHPTPSKYPRRAPLPSTKPL